MQANALGNETASWKEEVALHDGSRMVVDRSQTYGGYRRIDIPHRELIEETWKFTLPGSGKKVHWNNEFGLALSKSSLYLLTLDLVNEVPYIAAVPQDCISYNKWERPNPPYVFMKFDGGRWQRIPLTEFPAELKEANVAVGLPLKQYRSGTLSIATIKEINRHAPSYQRIFVREPITYGEGNMAGLCDEMVYDGKGGWRSPGGPIAPEPNKLQK